MAKIAPHARSWEDEAANVRALEDVGIGVSAGRSQHSSEDAVGWVGITFAVPLARLQEALGRMESVLSARRAGGAMDGDRGCGRHGKRGGLRFM